MSKEPKKQKSNVPSLLNDFEGVDVFKLNLTCHKMKRMPKKILLLAGVICFSFCGPTQRAALAPSQAQIEARAAEAAALSKRASLPFLKKAFAIYEELYAHPGLPRRISPAYVKTAILVAVREKEIGIVDNSYLDKALAAIRENGALAGYTLYADIARAIWVRQKGAMGDLMIRFDWRETEAMLDKGFNILRTEAATDEFAAYIFATAIGDYEYYFSGKGIKVDISQYARVYPDSLLIKYRAATSPVEDRGLLIQLTEDEPEFYEAYYHLGDMAVKEGKLLEAERNLLKAGEGIPESSQITIALASVYFATEELDKSLEYYNKTLAISPDYREALLGEAICLSYLGKSAAAMTILEKMIVLGNWLMGESHYWLAWNQHQLDRNEEAAANIEQAKTRLGTDSEVFGLSGTIALERGNLEQAEKDLKESLTYNANNTDSLFNLGRLYAQRQQWSDSGEYYGKSGLADERTEAVIAAKIQEIADSRLAEERKSKLIRIKENQQRTIGLTKATAFYDAAAGYFNAGTRARALEFARRSASHPAFKQKAEELIAKIKK
jgi:tetratricopeptide (TPR) repeat protein